MVPWNPIMPSFSLRLTVPNLVTYKDVIVTQGEVLVAALSIDRKFALHSDGHWRQRGCAPSGSIGYLLYALFCFLTFHFYLLSTVLNLSDYPWRLIGDEPSTGCLTAALPRSYLISKIFLPYPLLGSSIFTSPCHIFLYVPFTRRPWFKKTFDPLIKWTGFVRPWGVIAQADAVCKVLGYLNQM
jgi:hypothetical protein